MTSRVCKRAVFERYLTKAEEARLFKHVGQFSGVLARRDHAWMLLLRHTGIRVSSLAGLTVGDARSAIALRSLTLRHEHAKGGRGYEVACNKDAISALRTLLSVRREMGHMQIDDHPLVCSVRGSALSVRSFQARFSEWRSEAGLAVEASPHWLRHTLAKRLIAQSTARNPLSIVQAALGHRDLSSTGIYTLPDREELALAMEEAR